MTVRVDNIPLRTAVEAFAAAPDQNTYFEVLRAALQGDLLLDATGSELQFTPDGSSLAAGSTLNFHEGTAPDGGRALFAFTNQEQAQKMHPDAPDDVQTIGQSAVGTLGFGQAQDYAWLYIDPAGPTCALRVHDIQFVLRNDHNDAVKHALGSGPDHRAATIEALAAGGTLLYGVAEHEDGSVEILTSMSPEGEPVYLAFTSAAEVLARDPSVAVAAVDIARIVADAAVEPFAGLVINPSGPWIALTRDELLSLKSRLPEPADD